MSISKAIDRSLRSIKRDINVSVLKVPEIEQKTLDATSNEGWGPHGQLLAELGSRSFNAAEYNLMMNTLWKRMMDTGKNWRHVYKSLVVLEYLISHGSDRVVQELNERHVVLQSLADFQYVEAGGRDHGASIRQKAKFLLELISDKPRIDELRDRAAAAGSKIQGYSSSPRSGSGYGEEIERQRTGYQGTDDRGRGTSGSDPMRRSYGSAVYEDEVNRSRGHSAGAREGEGSYGGSARGSGPYDEEVRRTGSDRGLGPREDRRVDPMRKSYNEGYGDTTRHYSYDREKEGKEEYSRGGSRDSGTYGRDPTRLSHSSHSRREDSYGSRRDDSYGRGEEQYGRQQGREGSYGREDGRSSSSSSGGTRRGPVAPYTGGPVPDRPEMDEFDPRGGSRGLGRSYRPPPSVSGIAETPKAFEGEFDPRANIRGYRPPPPELTRDLPPIAFRKSEEHPQPRDPAHPKPAPAAPQEQQPAPAPPAPAPAGSAPAPAPAPAPATAAPAPAPAAPAAAVHQTPAQQAAAPPSTPAAASPFGDDAPFQASPAPAAPLPAAQPHKEDSFEAFAASFSAPQAAPAAPVAGAGAPTATDPFLAGAQHPAQASPFSPAPSTQPHPHYHPLGTPPAAALAGQTTPATAQGAPGSNALVLYSQAEQQPPPAPQAYPPQAYPHQSYPPQHTYPPPGYAPQSYPPQSAPPSGFPPQQQPQGQGFPPQQQPPAHGYGFPHPQPTPYGGTPAQQYGYNPQAQYGMPPQAPYAPQPGAYPPGAYAYPQQHAAPTQPPAYPGYQQPAQQGAPPPGYLYGAPPAPAPPPPAQTQSPSEPPPAGTFTPQGYVVPWAQPASPAPTTASADSNKPALEAPATPQTPTPAPASTAAAASSPSPASPPAPAPASSPAVPLGGTSSGEAPPVTPEAEAPPPHPEAVVDPFPAPAHLSFESSPAPAPVAPKAKESAVFSDVLGSGLIDLNMSKPVDDKLGIIGVLPKSKVKSARQLKEEAVPKPSLAEQFHSSLVGAGKPMSGPSLMTSKGTNPSALSASMGSLSLSTDSLALGGGTAGAGLAPSLPTYVNAAGPVSSAAPAANNPFGASAAAAPYGSSFSSYTPTPAYGFPTGGATGGPAGNPFQAGVGANPFGYGGAPQQQAYGQAFGQAPIGQPGYGTAQGVNPFQQGF